MHVPKAPVILLAMRPFLRMPSKPWLTLFLSTLLAPTLAHADLGERVTAALARGSFFAFALVFIGGILTSLTPCVYPMIPITLGIFGARGKSVTRGRAMGLAATYVGGIGVMYATLGVFSALAGKAFGTFMASPFVMMPIALLFIAMAASMFGAFELNLPTDLQTRLTQLGGAGWSGAFVMGLVGGIIAAPCTGPVLASVLTYVATTRSVVFGGSLLFTYALGMGILFFFLAASAASLPKSGAWMEAVKSIFGVVMLLAALYFLRNVVPALERYGDWHSRFAIIHAILITAGLGLGAIHLSFYSGWPVRVRKAVGIVLTVVGGFGLLSWTLAPRPLDWVQGEPAAVEQARREHKPLLLDFNAAWCLPCKELELKTFSNADVQRELVNRWVAAKVDCTEDDEAVAKVKARYGANTLPTVLLLDREGQPVAKWNRVVEPEELLEKLQSVP